MKNRPPYALGSVDNALRLLHLLRDHGSLRVSEAAAELGIARSTAHRLLAMLVYRDFAMQDDHRTYVPGPALTAGRVVGRPLARLRRALAPHMEVLCDRVGETVNLMVRVGTQVRFLSTVESGQVLRVGDRQGTILPAHLASGGKALLAELPEDQLRRLYRPEAGEAESGATPGERTGTEVDWPALIRALDGVRARGFALNVDETETGVSALGMCVRGRDREPLAALSVSAPSARFDRARVPDVAREMAGTVTRAERDLAMLPDG
ncbi:IclR family transcriptional regulator [Saccharomonospora saliphila]|uniref:IclR family transcriptional regulator n=1 Tax=Saccharomonospora saliphila TaxID=369829 RepID=UPI0003636F2A|nr:IclR family transcriptional regulator [Saccharomonospora saliphila]